MSNHVHGRPDNEEEHLDDLLGRGPGDPDVHGYPGEGDTRWVGQKPIVEHHHPDSEIEIVNDDGKITFKEIPF